MRPELTPYKVCKFSNCQVCSVLYIGFLVDIEVEEIELVQSSTPQEYKEEQVTLADDDSEAFDSEDDLAEDMPQLEEQSDSAFFLRA